MGTLLSVFAKYCPPMRFTTTIVAVFAIVNAPCYAAITGNFRGVRVVSDQAPDVQGDYHEKSWSRDQPEWYTTLPNTYGAQNTYNVSDRTRPWFQGPNGLLMMFVQSQDAWVIMDKERNPLYRCWGPANYPPFKRWERSNIFTYNKAGTNRRPKISGTFLRRVRKATTKEL